MMSLPISLLLFIVIFSPLIEGGTTHLPVTIIRLIVLFLATYWFITKVRRGGILFPKTIMDIPVILFTGLSCVSLVWSSYTAMSLQWLISIITYAIFFYLLVFYITRPRQIKLFVMVIIALGLFETAFAIVQAVSNNVLRPHGTFFNPNFLAGYLTGISGIVLGLFLWGWGEREYLLKRCIIYKLGMLVIFGTLSIGVLLTASRGGVLALLSVISFILLYRLRYKALIIMGVLVILVIITSNPLKERINSLPEADPYAYTRLQIWEDSVKRIPSYPLGAGLGIYKYTSQQSNFPIEGTVSRYGKRAETAHNEYLQIVVELGIAGLLIFIYGIYRLFGEFKSASSKFTQMQGVLIGAGGGITGILTHAAVDSNLHEPSIVLLLILLASFIILIRRSTGVSGNEFREVIINPGKKRFLYLVMTLIVAGCTFIIIRPAMAWYLYTSAENQIRSGNPIKAIKLLRLSTVVDPGNTAYHDHLANELVGEYVKTKRQEYLEEAFEEIHYAIDHNPLNGKAFNHLGFLYRLRADYEGDPFKKVKYLERSIEAFEKAVDLDPYSVFNYKEIGDISIQLGETDKAIFYLKKAISIEPNYLPARELLAHLYLGQDKYGLAEREYNNILNIYKRHQNKSLNILEKSYMNIDLVNVNRLHQMSMRGIR